MVEAILCLVKIGEWDNLGRARAALQRQLGELGAAEYAAHVTLNPDNGRLRIYVATDIGLLEYSYAPAGADPEGALDAPRPALPLVERQGPAAAERRPGRRRNR